MFLYYVLLLYAYFYLSKRYSTRRNPKEISNNEDMLAAYGFDDYVIAEDRAARRAFEEEKRPNRKGVITDCESYCWDEGQRLEYCYHDNEQHIRNLQLQRGKPWGLSRSPRRNSKEITDEDIWAAFGLEDDVIAEDRAVRLALEEEKRRKGKGVIIDDESYCSDEDERLQFGNCEDGQLECYYHDTEHAWNLQGRPDDTEHVRNLQRQVIRFCKGCGKVLRGKYVKCSRGVWHTNCFRCFGCRRPIKKTVVWRRNQPFHKPCAPRVPNIPKSKPRVPYIPKSEPRIPYIPKPPEPKSEPPPEPKSDPEPYVHTSSGSTCDVCSKSLTSNHVTSKCWGQKYCASHENDRTLRCCSCQSMEPRDTKYISLGDPRRLCLRCLDSAIMSTEECKPLLKDIENFYEGLQMKVDVDFRVVLVKRSELNRIVREENAHNLHKLPEVRGQTTFQTQWIRHIRYAPRWMGNGYEDPKTEAYKLVPHKSTVTGICVLYGYPRMLCGEILAHEMMHAWLRQNGYPPTLPPEVEEGIAQVMAYKWLKAESVAGNGGRHGSSKGKRSTFDKKLGEFFKQSLKDSQDPVYGEGFRKALRAEKTYGLKETLKHIKYKGRLP